MPATGPERISDVMRHLIDLAPGEDTVTVGSILKSFGVRGFAFLLMMLAALNVVIFMVPFISFLFGLPMVLLSAQMVIGLQSPVFPDVLLRQKVSRSALVNGIEIAIRWIEKCERYVKPRITGLFSPPVMKIHAVMAMLLSIMVMLPIPVVNVPPSIALILLSIGIIQRDGLFLIAGYASGVWCFWLFKSISRILHSVL